MSVSSNGNQRHGPWRIDHIDSVMVKLPGLKLMITRPSLPFGDLSLDVHQVLHSARDEGARVYLLRPKRVLNTAVYEISSDDVPIILQRDWLNSLLGFAWYFKRGLGVTRRHILGKPWKLVRKLWRIVRKRQSMPRQYGGQTAPVRAHYGSKFRWSHASRPIGVRLPDKQRKIAEAAADRVGLATGMNMVTLHVRESGFKPDRRPMEDARNADIETYFEAIDLLTSKGFTVVRIGDGSMTPVRRQGVLDLATSKERTDLLELWCVMASRFFMCCDSGAFHLGPLTNTPTLQVNAIDPILCYPMSSPSMFMPKRFADSTSGSVFPLDEMIASERYNGVISQLQSYQRETSYDVIDNSPEELRDAAAEMLVRIQGGERMTAHQAEYRERMLQLCEALRSQQIKNGYWERRFGPGDLFLGDGAVVDSFAKRYLNPSRTGVAVPRRTARR